MKRCILFAVLFALLLPGCGTGHISRERTDNTSTSQTETTEPTEETIPRAEVPLPEETARGFSAYLDFMLCLPEKKNEWRELIGQFKHDGIPISEEWRPTSMHGPNGYDAVYEGYGNYGAHTKWYTKTVTELGRWGKVLKYETYHSSYGFNTGIELEGFTMPFGIALYDEMAKVLESLGTDIDPLEVFGENPGDQTELLLYESDRETVILKDLRSELKGGKSFGITYTECYEITTEDGYQETVTRTVNLSFSQKTYKLENVGMRFQEYCEKR